MKGFSINNFDLKGKSYPLIWGGDAANYSKGVNSELASECLPGRLDADKIKGKIVYCSSFSDGSDIKLAGPVGTIMVDFDTDTAFSYASPVTQLTIEDGQKVLNYIKSTKYTFHRLLSKPRSQIQFGTRNENQPVSGIQLQKFWFPNPTLTRMPWRHPFHHFLHEDRTL